MKLGMNTIPPEAIPLLCFLIFYHEQYQHGGSVNLWGGNDICTA